MGRPTDRSSWTALAAGIALLALTAASWPVVRGPGVAAAASVAPTAPTKLPAASTAPPNASTSTTLAPTTMPPPAVAPVSTTTTTTPTASTTTTPTASTTAPPSAAERAARFALTQVGKPYRFAAAGPAAYDCSGLTLAAYATAGVLLPHYAAAQARLGRAVDWGRHGVRAGDLVFTAGGRPRHDLGHVGIAVSATEWVSAPAPGKVVRRSAIPFRLVQAVRRLAGAERPA